ncbi:hypothetical protein [Methanosarcina sp. Kolksee]|uniref:hypothetical protein n=1 Tax=Methanosarcina sp. Kolksee TaxID=1434099 RepID=UPI000B0C3D28|nr:hypothetical protein [Methanosarcina sp. Kolksee]
MAVFWLYMPYLAINDPYVIVSPGFGFSLMGFLLAVLRYRNLKSKMKISPLRFTKIWILESRA